MHAIQNAFQSAQLLAGYATPAQMARVRVQGTKAACCQVIVQIRNAALVAGCGLSLPVVGQALYSFYSLTPPGRYTLEDYEFQKALAIGAAALCTLAFLPNSLREIKKSVMRIYDPVGTRRRIFIDRIVQFVKDMLRLVGMLALFALPGIFSWQVLQMVLVSVPTALTQSVAQRLNDVARLLVEMRS